MLTEIYIEALLIDEELADQVWEAWVKGEILTPMFEFNLTHFWQKTGSLRPSSGTFKNTRLL